MARGRLFCRALAVLRDSAGSSHGPQAAIQIAPGRQAAPPDCEETLGTAAARVKVARSRARPPKRSQAPMERVLATDDTSSSGDFGPRVAGELARRLHGGFRNRLPEECSPPLRFSLRE